MPSVETAFGHIFYLARGVGTPPIVALHGAAGTGSQWGYQIADLSAVTQVIALDLPGHGRSSGAGLHTIADGAAQVVAVLDALHIDRAIMLGHSMGGAIAQWLALHEATRMAGLIVVGAAAQLPISADLLHNIRRNWPAAARQIVALAYASGTVDAALRRAVNDVRQVDPAVVAADYNACAAFDVRAALHEIRVPVLWIAGANDHLAPPVLVAAAAQHCTKSELVIVPDAGHMVMIEQPNAVNQALRRWLHKYFTFQLASCKG